MSKLIVPDHSLIKHKISILRDKNTDVKSFRNLIGEIATLVGYEVTKDLPMENKTVETPLCETMGSFISNQVVLVPVLRAGLGMVDAFLNLVPAAKVGHIGLSRNHETLLPEEYYCNLPSDIAEREVFVLDPMLATGGSASFAIDCIKKRGASKIRYIGIIGAPEGVSLLQKNHPDVDIYLAVLDEKLNEHGYIMPGLGDAGDRIFGTL